MPNGPTFLTRNSQAGVRNTQERSDIDFYEGSNPRGIYRRFQANNQGLIGDDVNTFPTTGDMVRIPHRAVIVRRGEGIRTRGNPVISDETAYVPGWAVGDPR